jgi:hypothetical protein
MKLMYALDSVVENVDCFKCIDPVTQWSQVGGFSFIEGIEDTKDSSQLSVIKSFLQELCQCLEALSQ